jgi:hypothetical protein
MYADWNKLLSLEVHPTRLLIVEAMEWIEVPVSSVALDSTLDLHDVNHVAYHVRKLAEGKVIVQVGQRPVRGATEHFYVLEGPPRICVDLSVRELTALRDLVLAFDQDDLADITEAATLTELRDAFGV